MYVFLLYSDRVLCYCGMCHVCVPALQWPCAVLLWNVSCMCSCSTVTVCCVIVECIMYVFLLYSDRVLCYCGMCHVCVPALQWSCAVLLWNVSCMCSCSTVTVCCVIVERVMYVFLLYSDRVLCYCGMCHVCVPALQWPYAVLLWNVSCMCSCSTMTVCCVTVECVMYVFLLYSDRVLCYSGMCHVCVPALQWPCAVLLWNVSCMCSCSTVTVCCVTVECVMYVFLLYSDRVLCYCGMCHVCVPALQWPCAVLLWNVSCMCSCSTVTVCCVIVECVMYVFLLYSDRVLCYCGMCHVCVPALQWPCAVLLWNVSCMCSCSTVTVCCVTVECVMYVFLLYSDRVLCYCGMCHVCVPALQWPCAVLLWNVSCMCSCSTVTVCCVTVECVMYVFLLYSDRVLCYSGTCHVFVPALQWPCAVLQWNVSCICSCSTVTVCCVTVERVMYVFLLYSDRVLCYGGTCHVCVPALQWPCAVLLWNVSCICSCSTVTVCCVTVECVMYLFLLYSDRVLCYCGMCHVFVPALQWPCAVLLWNVSCICSCSTVTVCCVTVECVMYLFLLYSDRVLCYCGMCHVCVPALQWPCAVLQWNVSCICSCSTVTVCCVTVECVMYVFLLYSDRVLCYSGTCHVFVPALQWPCAVLLWNVSCMCSCSTVTVCCVTVECVLYVFLFYSDRVLCYCGMCHVCVPALQWPCAVLLWNVSCMCSCSTVTVCCVTVECVMYVFLLYSDRVLCYCGMCHVCVLALQWPCAVLLWNVSCMCSCSTVTVCCVTVERVMYVFLLYSDRVLCYSGMCHVCVPALQWPCAVLLWNVSCMCSCSTVTVCCVIVECVMYVFLLYSDRVLCYCGMCHVCVPALQWPCAVLQWNVSCMCSCSTVTVCCVIVECVMYVFLLYSDRVLCYSGMCHVCVPALQWPCAVL